MSGPQNPPNDGDEPTRVRPVADPTAPVAPQGAPGGPSDPYGASSPSAPGQPEYGHPPAQPGYGQGGPGQGGPAQPEQPGYGQPSYGQTSYGQPVAPGGYAPSGGSPDQTYSFPPAPGQPSGPGSMPPPGRGFGGPPPGGPPRKSRKVLVAVIAAVVALILVVGGGLGVKHFLDKRAEEREAAAYAEDKEAQEEAAVGTTEALFAAVTDASADDALALLSEEPDDSTLITDEVLADSSAEVAVEDTKIVEISEDLDTAQVSTVVNVGSESAEWTLDLVRDGDDWLVSSELPLLEVSSGVALQVNGVEVSSGDALSVFPGTYTFATGAERVAYGNDTTVVVEQAETSWSGEAELTSAGSEFVAERARATLRECARKKELAPEGCPMAVNASSSQQVDSSTISRTVTNDPLRSPDIVFDDGTATIDVTIEWDFDAEGSVDGQSATFSTSGNDPWRYVVIGLDTSSPQGSWIAA